MSDTLASLPPPTPPGPSANVADNLTATVTAAPELSTDPATAAAVAATGGDVITKGQAVAHAIKQTANLNAAQQVNQASGGGFFSDLGHDLTDVASGVMHVLNKPLSIVQHEYRYLHDVEARYGAGAALLDGLGLAAGAVVGGIAGAAELNPLSVVEGATLGAEGAGALEGQVFHPDSWARTTNGATYRDPHTGQLVSFGRDITSDLGIGGGTKTVLSGVIDGIADLTADPVAVIGKAYKAQKTVSIVAENIDKAWNNPLTGFRRAAEDIANSDYGTILTHYPQFTDIAKNLAELHTGEQVRDFFKSITSANELLQSDKIPDATEAADGVTTTAKNLPSLSPLHVPFRSIRDLARDAGEGDSFFARHFANNAVIGPRTWADRLEALPGNTFDKDAMDLTGGQYDPSTNTGDADVIKMVRYSRGITAAKAVANAMQNATEAQRIVIFRNAFLSTVFHMARYDIPGNDLTNPEMEHAMLELVDGKTKQALVERLENHMAAVPVDGTPTGTLYGMDWKGDGIRPVVDDEGVRIQGGITPNQRGKLSIPNIVEARRMAQAIRQAKTSMFLGGVDDFFYDHVTQGLFKPLVLMSGGYALHIALAELIPNTLRHGLRASIETVRDRAFASLGWQADKAGNAELDGLTGWLYRMIGGDKIKDRQEVEWMLQSRMLAGGDAAPEGFQAGEALQGEVNPQLLADKGYRQLMQNYRQGSRFYAMDSSDSRFAEAWHAELAENVNRWTMEGAKAYREAIADGMSWQEAMEVGRKAIARKLREDAEAGQTMMVRSTHLLSGAPPSWDAIDGHAQALMDKLMGAVHGRPTQFDDTGVPTAPGPVHDDLLASIANGMVPRREDVWNINPGQRPLNVKGRELIPFNDSMVQKIADKGFRKLLNPIVNFISRNQEYNLELVSARRELQPLVDAGLMSDDEAITKAMATAVQHGMRFVHNLHDRTQWTATMRNWAPFFFAQEQAYRRMGRLLVEDPGAFRRYQLMISGVHNLATTMQDSQGNRYIAFPGSGFLGTGVAELMGEGGLTVGNVAPASLGGSFSSANVIFPFSAGIKPDLGPLVIVPAAQLSSMFAELNQNYAGHNRVLSVAANDLAAVAGSEAMSQSFWEQIIPNATAQRLLQSVLGDDRAFNSAVMQSYQWAQYQQAQASAAWVKGGRKGKEPQIIPPPNATAMQKQQFQDKIRNYTRMLFFVRALTGFASPVSANVEIQNLNIPARLQEYITKEGSVALGMQAAHLDHPDWDPWMVSQSYVPSEIDKTQSSDISLASSAPAMEWIDQNQGLLDKYGVAALWLMPQLRNSQYSPTIYNEQIAQGLRIKDTPDQFLAALYVNAGNNLYYDALTIHEAALTAAGKSSVAVNAEYDNWNSYVTQLEQQNPVWAENFLSPDKQLNRQNAIKQLTAMFATGDAPPGPMTHDVQYLLQQYDQAAAEYQLAGTAPTYSLQLSEQKKVSDNWIQYVTNLETEMPQLKPVINGVFKEALVVKT